MKIYISGPMRGMPELNFPAFRDAARRIELLGHRAIDPSRNHTGLTRTQYMDIDLALVRASDAALMLPGYESSSGAAVELAYARYLGLYVFFNVNAIPTPAQWPAPGRGTTSGQLLTMHIDAEAIE